MQLRSSPREEAEFSSDWNKENSSHNAKWGWNLVAENPESALSGESLSILATASYTQESGVFLGDTEYLPRVKPAYTKLGVLQKSQLSKTKL